jgi:hypothetical protein
MESKKCTFDSANMSLRIKDVISQEEFEVFDRIRDLRNKLVHDIFRNSFDQNRIERYGKRLEKNILRAYRESQFLEDKLFQPYGIKRTSEIQFNPPSMNS